MKFNTVYYESDSLAYPLGEQPRETFKDPPQIPIDSHNSIKEMQEKPNSEFGKMKRNLIVGIWEIHKYAENQKTSDYPVPYTSSGCIAMCLCCYLICNYGKCAYLHLSIDRERMLDCIIKWDQKSKIPLTFGIGSNNDLVPENTIIGNLLYMAPRFARGGIDSTTFPTKFHVVDPLLGLSRQGKTISRMSANPQPIISKIELGTPSLSKRIEAVSKMCEVGYPCGPLVAPVILAESWKVLHTGLLEKLRDGLTEKARNQIFLEITSVTYLYIHRVVNSEVFPNAPEFYDTEQVTGRGRGRYCYRLEVKAKMGTYFQGGTKRILGDMHILHIS